MTPRPHHLLLHPRPEVRSHSRSRAAALALTALLLAGCGSGVTTQDATPDPAAALTLENCGREVVVDAAPTAIVGMHPAQTELLLRLGLADRMAGQAQAAAQALPEDVAPLAADVPVLGEVAPPSREELLAVEPDFVYAPTTYEFSAEQGFASLDQLEQSGAAVYVATGGCADRRMTGEVTDLFEDLTALGEAFDVQDEAEQLIAEGRADLEAVEEATAEVAPLRVAQVYYEGGTLQAIGAGIEHDILLRAGADPVHSPEQEAFSDFFAAPLTPEALAAEAPDAIVFAAYDEEHEAATREYLTTTFPDMPAVAEDRLIAVSTADMFPGTLGNISAVEQIAAALYPEQF
ncbi:ABC transporter substrate-binding protein [Brachybacterium saurashtrense]|uniref:Zinc ABC transporter substrate-binding protein n=1 Tax=Brachybacterium saurashtrense TaxID=556288 RepID=A0A345YQD5_9MICO|nr:ABC transporter substrate-binding protein [Brachybacterium saurashtrense]AXK46137.1 zinc ABC transporter substrate-binding protein [Brachybacterium saurashtrense]RRR23877.1 zinc ABC transporter substrate-binding protein [Brachybacterium saurashtrense]